MRREMVLITGGARGIGLAVARQCVKDGLSVAICSRTVTDLESAKKELNQLVTKGQSVETYLCDVVQEEEVKRVIQGLLKHFDLCKLVCCAGIIGPIGDVETTQSKDWEQVFRVNVLGSFHPIKHLVPYLKERKQGKIVLFSGGGEGGFPQFAAYAASKGAIWRLTESLGKELSEYGIDVNAIAPGAVDTKMTDDMLKAGEEKTSKDFIEKTRKWKGEGGVPPEKAARLISYLLSNRSNGLYGKILSAVWDDYENFDDLEKISESALFNVRRVIDEEGGTRPRKN